MALLLGLGVAAGFGCADFLGGLASRRSRAVTVVFLAQASGLLGILVYLGALRSSLPPAHDVGLAAGAGVAGLVGVAALYRGLGLGRMSVVAPLSAIVAAAVPVVWGLATGERPSSLALGGVVVALASVVFVTGSSSAESAGEGRLGIEAALAVTAGMGFGTAFVLFAHTGEESGLWPVLVARSVAVPVVIAVLFARRDPFLPDRADRRAAVGAGLLDATATGLLLLAVRTGLMSLVAPVASLYPGVTVVLARAVVRESVTRGQLLGLALALAGLALIAAG